MFIVKSFFDSDIYVSLLYSISLTCLMFKDVDFNTVSYVKKKFTTSS